MESSFSFPKIGNGIFIFPSEIWQWAEPFPFSRVQNSFPLTPVNVFQNLRNLRLISCRKPCRVMGSKKLKDLLLKRERRLTLPHNTRHRVERLESFAFLKEFSGISYQTQSRGKAKHWRFPIEILYKMELAERANFHFVKKFFNPLEM